jgi:uncharacterized protein (TIGR02594 family)
MIEQHSGTEDYENRWKFNGKELDTETGLYYYGARYYDPSVSIWMSVDPLAEKFPAWNPYNYTMQNPINLIDPDGMAPDGPAIGGPVRKTFLTNKQLVDLTSILNNYQKAEKKRIEAQQKETKRKLSTPWMTKAKGEIGVKEKTGKNDGTKVEEYLKTTGLSKGNAWCGAFVNWCLEESSIDGIVPSKDAHPARALSWRGFGDDLDKPAFGAIASKKRKGEDMLDLSQEKILLVN